MPETTYTYATAEKSKNVTDSLLEHTRRALHALSEHDEELEDHQEDVRAFLKHLAVVEDVLVPVMGQRPSTLSINLARAVKALAETIDAQALAYHRSMQQALSLSSMFVDDDLA